MQVGSGSVSLSLGVLMHKNLDMNQECALEVIPLPTDRASLTRL